MKGCKKFRKPEKKRQSTEDNPRKNDRVLEKKKNEISTYKNNLSSIP